MGTARKVPALRFQEPSTESRFLLELRMNRRSHLLLAILLLTTRGAMADTMGFDIVLIHSNALTLAEQAAFDAAEATWESLIFGFQDTIGDTILEITTNLAFIDGVGGTLGSAGPNSIKIGAEANFSYAASGSMNFDTADTANLATTGTLDDVILHEMGHVLGIGTLWNISALTSTQPFASTQNLYTSGTGQYTGANAIAAWQGEFGQADAFMPVELGGGPGTANGHWNEVNGGGSPTGIVSLFGPNAGKDFQNELMTGWLGGDTFISNVTKGGLMDLGYIVPSFQSSATAAVPEPGTFAFCMVLFSGVAIRQKRRKKRIGTD